MSNEEFLNSEEKWNILVIDDSKLSRAIVKKTLSQMNMSITEAHDGREGLALLSKNHFDLILLDIIMPISMDSASSKGSENWSRMSLSRLF